MLSIIIPVYNEEDSLPHLFARIDGFVDSLRGIEVEVIFVDDHSADRSNALLNEFCAGSTKYKYLRLSRNSGSHKAILAGLHFSKGDCAVFLAADLQDPIELVNDMLVKWKEGYEVIWAIRKKIEGISRRERAMGLMFYKLLNLAGEIKLPPSGADFALMDKKVVEALLRSTGANPSLGGLLVSVGFKSFEIEYVKQERKFGKSKWSFSKRLTSAIDAFVSFSYVPMRLMTYIGLFLALVGFLYALVIIGLNIAGASPIMGWSSMMVAVLIIGGVQMIMMGIIGEYLWRTLEEAKKKPLFFVEECSSNLNEAVLAKEQIKDVNLQLK